MKVNEQDKLNGEFANETAINDSFLIASLKVKHDNYYEVKCLNEMEEYVLLIKLETYYHDHLRKDLIISREKVNKYLEEDAYNQALLKAYHYLAYKDRTRKEMFDYLIQNTNLAMKTVNELIERFEKEGYLNDEAYVVNQVESMRSALMGRKRIQQELVKRGIPYDMVNEELASIEESSFVNNAKVVIANTLPMLKGKNSLKSKEFIQNKLLRLGYNYSVINEAMSEFEFAKDEDDERNLLSKEFAKQYSRLSLKYQGYELKAKLITALIRKGFAYDLVKEFVEENVDGLQIDK